MSTSNLFPSEIPESKIATLARSSGNGLSNLPIAWKMGLIILILSLVTLSVGTIAWFGLRTMHYHLDNIYGCMLVPIVSMSSADSAMSDNQFELQKLLGEGSTSVQLKESLDTIE